MNYKHIVWDWNGTLLADTEASAQAVSRMMEKRNMGRMTLDEYRAKIDFPVIQLYQTSGFDLERETYEAICEEYIRNYIDNISMIKLQENAQFVLDRFNQRNLEQHIVSASGLEILLEQVNYYGLTHFFSHILGQEDNQADSKVHLAKKLSERIECDPKEVLFIGDTIHDYEVSKEAGFDCNLVSNGHCSRERLEGTGVPVYYNLLALYEALSL